MKRPMLILLLTIMINIFLCINFHVLIIILLNIFLIGGIINFRLTNQYTAILILSLILSLFIFFKITYEVHDYGTKHLKVIGHVSRYKMKKSKQMILKDVRIIYPNDLIKLKHDILVEYTGDINSVIGKKIKANMIIKIPDQSNNPNSFDYRKYLRSKGIGYIASLHEKNITVIDSPNFNLSRLRIYIENEFNNYLFNTYNNKTAAFLKGFIVGDKSAIEQELLDDFYSVGLGHILVVSGLHFGLLYIILKYILKALYISAVTKSIIISLILFIFLCFIGMPLSAMRAYIFIITYEFIYLINRRIDLLNYVSFIGIILLIMNPFMIYSLSFQLSFGAILSIGLFYQSLNDKLPRVIALTLSVQGIIAFLNVHHFNYFNFSSFIINIPIHFVVGLLYLLVLINFLLWPFKIITFGIHFIVGSITQLVVFFSSLNFLKMSWPSFTSIEILLIIFVFSCIIINLEKGLFKIKHFILGVLIFSIGINGYLIFNETLEISFYDVGNADSSLITTPQGKNILIDSGRETAYDSITSILLKDGIKSVDYLILTHNHSDHIGGALELLDRYSVDHLFLSQYSKNNEEMDRILSKLNSLTQVHYLKKGDGFTINNVKFHVLNPISEGLSENNQSLVLNVSYLTHRVLLTGDIEEETELSLIRFIKKSVDIIKVPHHGSETSSKLPFINKIKPQYGIIQVGQNTYGHPSEKVLKNYAINDTMIFRNDYHGCIKVKLNKDINITTMKAK